MDAAEPVLELRRRIDAAPRDASLHERLGLMLWKKGELLDAVIEFRKVRRIDPGDAGAVFALAALSHQRRQFHKAFEYLFDLAQGDKNLPQHWGTFPDPYDKIDWPALLTELTESARKDRRYLEAAMKEGFLCLEQRCTEKALRIFTRLVALAPRHAQFRLHRALALAEDRRESEAEAEFAEVLLLEPKSAAAYKGLALLRAKKGENEKARQYFEEVLKIAPEDPDAKQWVREHRA